jgi:lipid II:glycine glycyltransferase (peptidoglycan interpeptide bridge formation enzyme)
MHICQSPEWVEVKTKIGTPAVLAGGLPAGRQGVQFTLHKVPLLPFNIGYCPKVDPEKIDWEKLKAAAKERRCIFVKLEPNEQFNNLIDSKNRRLDRTIQQLRPSKPIFATQTILLDLTKSEEELLAGMKQKTRYNVRLAEKKGVVVEERSDPEALEIFLRLQKETAQRQGFFIHPDSYYRTVWEVLHPKGMAFLLVASVRPTSDNNLTIQQFIDSKNRRLDRTIPLVAWMLLKYQDTLYYPYGGSSGKFKNYMASNLVMWEAIKLGKKLGCKVFDMWGATDDQQDPWYGFTRFKLGYGGQLVSFPGAYDLILKQALYWPFILIDKIRWGLLSLWQSIRR